MYNYATYKNISIDFQNISYTCNTRNAVVIILSLCLSHFLSCKALIALFVWQRQSMLEVKGSTPK